MALLDDAEREGRKRLKHGFVVLIAARPCEGHEPAASRSRDLLSRDLHLEMDAIPHDAGLYEANVIQPSHRQRCLIEDACPLCEPAQQQQYHFARYRDTGETSTVGEGLVSEQREHIAGPRGDLTCSVVEPKLRCSPPFTKRRALEESAQDDTPMIHQPIEITVWQRFGALAR